MKLSNFILFFALSTALFSCAPVEQEENREKGPQENPERIIAEDATPEMEEINITEDSLPPPVLDDTKAPPPPPPSIYEMDVQPMPEEEEVIIEETGEEGVVIISDREGGISFEKTTSKMSLKKISKIVYRFRDSSVPPPYHRSYSVTVTPKGSNHIVTDYSDELSNTTEKLKDGAWDELVKMAQDLQDPGAYSARGATGTTGNTIDIYWKGELIYQLYWDSLSDEKIKKSAFAFKDAINATAADYNPLR